MRATRESTGERVVSIMVRVDVEGGPTERPHPSLRSGGCSVHYRTSATPAGATVRIATIVIAMIVTDGIETMATTIGIG